MRLNDRQRIEHSLVPALLQATFVMHAKGEEQEPDEYRLMAWRAQDVFLSYFADLPAKRRHQLYKRADRIANKVIGYAQQNKFTTRKAILAITEWVRALLPTGVVLVEEDSDYWRILEETGAIVAAGYEKVPDFDKIDLSAINHVPAIHKLVQGEGYFLDLDIN